MYHTSSYSFCLLDFQIQKRIVSADHIRGNAVIVAIEIKFLRNMYNLIYMKKHHIFICYPCISFISDLGIFSSVSRFTFEEYEGNSAAAVGLKGMFTILFFFINILCFLSFIQSQLSFDFFFLIFFQLATNSILFSSSNTQFYESRFFFYMLFEYFF